MSLGRCYSVERISLNWASAQQSCRQKYNGNLAGFSSGSQYNGVISSLPG